MFVTNDTTFDTNMQIDEPQPGKLLPRVNYSFKQEDLALNQPSQPTETPKEHVKMPRHGMKFPLLTNVQRQNIIYLSVVHNMSIQQISLATHHHYGTVKKIIETYHMTGVSSATTKKSKQGGDVFDPASQMIEL